MSGDPIYLVSACTTGEQFVAAFRRYADRSGLFIPIADPIAVGKRGRFAVTLADGGVMVEGEAEVVSSTRTPSVLHGRIGMTVRFLEPDEASKTTLVELEKARLAMKPPPPSMAPRPAAIPAEPRSVPPPASGRVDAANALAECVAIGDLEALGVAPPAPKPTGPKFVVPSIAPVPVDDRRSRSPSGPHRARVPSTTPPTSAPSARPRPPTGQQPLAPRPAEPPLRETLRGTKGPGPTSTQPSAVVPPPRPATPSTPPPMPSLPSPGDSGKVRNATMALPALVRAPAPPSNSGPIPVVMDESVSGPVPEPSIVIAPSGPTAVGVVPIVELDVAADENAAVLEESVPEAIVAPHVDLDEPTDLTDIPITRPPTPGPFAAVPQQRANESSSRVERPDKSDRIPRKTVLGIAVVPDGMTVLPATPSTSSPGMPVPDTSVMASQKPTVEEPTPSGNWTLTPGADKPTIEPRGPKVELPPVDPQELAAEPSSPEIKKPVERLTGDWSIALDPERPDGWSEPSKIEKRPVRAQTSPGPPVAAVASTRDLISQPVAAQPDPSTSEPKVQIDPTLIEVAREMPTEEVAPLGTGLGVSAGYAVPGTPSGLHALATGPTGMHPIAGPGGYAAQPGPLSAPISAPVAIPATPSGSYPRAPSQSAEMSFAPPPLAAVPPPDGFVPLMPTPAPGTIPPFTPPPGTIAGTGSQSAYPPPQPRFGSEPNVFGGQSFVGDQAYAPPKSKRTLVIIVSAILAVAIGIVALVMLTRGSGDSTPTREKAVTPTDAPTASVTAQDPVVAGAAPAPVDAAESGSATPPTPGSAAPQAPGSGAALEPGAGEEPTPQIAVTPTKPAEPVLQTTGDCTVGVSSTPSGAELAIGSKVVGTTPATLTLPCATEVRLVARKPRFNSAVRTFTPNKSAKVKLKLDHQTFQVKVSSSPAGATVTVGGKSIGVTPSTARLPAFETSVLVFSKPGYQSETQRVTPKQNNQTIHTPLKKSGKKPK